MPFDAGTIDPGDPIAATFIYNGEDGTAPYDYEIDISGISGSGIVPTITNDNEITFNTNAARAGSYVIVLRGRVIDALGDEDSDGFDDLDTLTVTVRGLTASWDVGASWAPASIEQAGTTPTATLTVASGGVSPYNYLMELVNAPAGVSIVQSSPTDNAIELTVLGTQAPGVYNFTLRGQVQDATGQYQGPYDVDVTLTVLGMRNFVWSPTPFTQSLEWGETSNVATVVPGSGGVGPYTYEIYWSVPPIGDITLNYVPGALTCTFTAGFSTTIGGQYNQTIRARITDSVGNRIEVDDVIRITATGDPAPIPPTYAELMAIYNPEYRQQFESVIAAGFVNSGTESGTQILSNPGSSIMGVETLPTTDNLGMHLNDGATRNSYLLGTDWDIVQTIGADTGTIFFIVKPDADIGIPGVLAQGYTWSVNDGFDDNNMAAYYQHMSPTGDVYPDHAGSGWMSMFGEEGGGNTGEVQYCNLAGGAGGGVNWEDGNFHTIMMVKHRTGLAGEVQSDYIDFYCDGYKFNDTELIGDIVGSPMPANWWFNIAGFFSGADRLEFGRRAGGNAEFFSGIYDDWWYAENLVLTEAQAAELQVGLGLPVHVPAPTIAMVELPFINLNNYYKWDFRGVSGTILDSGIEHTDIDLSTHLNNTAYNEAGPFLPSNNYPRIRSNRWTAGYSYASAPNARWASKGFDKGYVSMWFKLTTDGTRRMLIGIGSTGGDTLFELAVNTNNTVGMLVRRNGSGNQHQFEVNVGGVSLSDWHYVAAKQKADGTGIELMYDGTWYTVVDAAYTVTSLVGTGDTDDWIESLVVQGIDRLCLGARTVLSDRITGSLSQVGLGVDLHERVYFDRIWDEGSSALT